MISMTRFPRLLVYTSVLQALVLSGVSFAQPLPLNTPPSAWAAPDAQPVEEAFSLHVASFPSRVLAASLAESLENLGWRPVRVLKRDDGFGVYIGYSRTPGLAEFFRLELATQEIANANVVSLTAEEVPLFEEAIVGPVRNPFADDFGFNRSWFRSSTSQNTLTETILSLPVASPSDVREKLAVYLNRENTDAQRGTAAADLLDALFEHKALPEQSFFLARQLANGELPVENDRRVKAMEVCAVLYLGHFYDWRRAWSATRLLTLDPYRDPQGLIRDELRQLALEVELTIQPNQQFAVNHPRLRSQLKSLYNRVPIENPRLAAKVELFVLKTYAWEGNWDQVQLHSRQFIQRNGSFSGELVEAKLLYARSFEQTQEYGRALDELADIKNHFPTHKESLFRGYDSPNLQDRQFEWQTYFDRKKSDVEAVTEDILAKKAAAEAELEELERMKAERELRIAGEESADSSSSEFVLP